MIFWTFRWILISIVIILLIHYIYKLLLDTLTVPKVRDLLSHRNSQYEEFISSYKDNNHANDQHSLDRNISLQSQQPQSQSQPQPQPQQQNTDENHKNGLAMQDELKTFLNGLSTTQNNGAANNDVPKIGVTKLEDL